MLSGCNNLTSKSFGSSGSGGSSNSSTSSLSEVDALEDEDSSIKGANVSPSSSTAFGGAFDVNSSGAELVVSSGASVSN